MGQMKQEYILTAKYEGKGELGKLQADLKALGKIESMKALGKDVRELTTKFQAAQKELEEQARAMKNADTVTKEMSASYALAQREVVKLSSALDKKKVAFKAATAATKEAGVDTKNLASEEKRLQAAAKETGTVWAARRALGVRSHADIRAEVGRLNLAYTDLKTSGKASATELLIAQRSLNTKTKELRKSTSGWAVAMGDVHTKALGLAAAGYAIAKVFGGYSGFATGMAEVYTLLDMSKEKFDSYKDDVREVMSNLSQNTGDLTKSLYDLISAGVDIESSGKSLELAAQASVAGITDTNTAVNVGIGAVNAYGDNIENLESYYDILFQTAKSGVTTFSELAQSLGDVLPTARAAKVNFAEVGAAIAALTKAGIKTPQAATALKGAIRAMAAPTPEAEKQFKALGITWQGLVPTLEAIAEKGLSIDQMRMIIPDAEASTGVLALTQNLDSFRDILLSMDGAAGSMKEAYAKMEDTPEHKIALLKKSFAEMGISLGQLISVGLIPAANGIKWMVNLFNDASPVVKGFAGGILFLGTVVGGLAFVVKQLGLGSFVTWLYNTARASSIAAGGIAAARNAVLALRVAMLANPITAVFVALLTAAAIAYALFADNSLEASKKHGEAAKEIAKGRKVIDDEIASLEKYKKILDENKEGTDEHAEAQRELAKILPDANVGLDEQGRLIVENGKAIAKNVPTLEEYIKLQKEKSNTELALQLEQQVKAYNGAGESLTKYKDKLKNLYAIGGEDDWSTWIARNVEKLNGNYDKNIKKGGEVRKNLDEQKKAYYDLLQSMSKTGLTADQLSTAFDGVHISAELKQQIFTDYAKLSDSVEGVAETAEETAKRLKDALVGSIPAIQAEYVKLAEKVKGILAEIAGREESLTAELRAMRRSGMGDYSAWKDLKAEAEEYYEAAQNAASAGNFDEATRLADIAKDKYRDLNEEVKEGDKIVVDRAKAEALALEGVKKSGELAIEALQQSAKESEENAKALEKNAGEFSKGWSEAWSSFLKDGTAAVSSLEKKLDAMAKARTIDVGINSHQNKQHGGLIQQMATGGAVRSALSGFYFPGYGGGDQPKNLVMAENGEVMIKKESVRSGGVRAALAYNAGRFDIVVAELLKRFGSIGAMRKQMGGEIGDPFSHIRTAIYNSAAPILRMQTGGVVASSAGSSPSSPTYNITINAPGGAATQNAKALAKQVVAELEKLHRRSS